MRAAGILGFGAVAILTALTLLRVERLDPDAGRESSTAPQLPPARTRVPAEFSGSDFSRPGVELKPSPTRAVERTSPLAEIHAVAALVDTDGSSADSALVAAALGSAEVAVREEAVFALAERGDPEALQTLQQTLHDPSLRVQKATIQALGEVGGEGAVSVLGAALDVAVASLRLNAVDVLGQMDHPDAVRHLERALYDESEIVREAADEWLAEKAGEQQ